YSDRGLASSLAFVSTISRRKSSSVKSVENIGAVGYDVYRGPCWLNRFSTSKFIEVFLLMCYRPFMIFDAEFFYAINQVLSVLGWGGRQYAVAEIEDMPRTGTETFENACRFVPYFYFGSKKHAWVKVSLNRFPARLITRF